MRASLGQLVGLPLFAGVLAPRSTSLQSSRSTRRSASVTGRRSRRGRCSAALTVHIVPDDGPLSHCQHAYTGALRYSRTGACSSVERTGVIPG